MNGPPILLYSKKQRWLPIRNCKKMNVTGLPAKMKSLTKAIGEIPRIPRLRLDKGLRRQIG